MSFFFGVLVALKYHKLGREKNGARKKEPIRSLPAAANSPPLFGQNSASHLDLSLFYTLDAKVLSKEHPAGLVILQGKFLPLFSLLFILALQCRGRGLF